MVNSNGISRVRAVIPHIGFTTINCALPLFRGTRPQCRSQCSLLSLLSFHLAPVASFITNSSAAQCPKTDVSLNARDKGIFVQPEDKWQLLSTVQAGGIDGLSCAVGQQASRGVIWTQVVAVPALKKSCIRSTASFGARDCPLAITSVVTSGTDSNGVVGGPLEGNLMTQYCRSARPHG
jgi:hypothetical protein